MRIFAAIVALCAAAFLAVCSWRWWKTDPRLPSQGALGGAVLILLASSMVALARPSPYPPVTPFEGDRYSGRQTHLGPEVTRAMRCPPPACARKKLNRRVTAAPRRLRHVPVPRARPLTSNPYRVNAPLSVGDGIRREVARGIGRPAAWCGWYLGQLLGKPARHLWLARNWAKEGVNAGGPQIGAVVVWRHHVGIITGKQNGQWVVKSGNDGRRVRERPRSVAGAIAFRRVS